MDASRPFRGRRVTVMGLGRFGGGVGVTRWLCRQGAAVIVSDKAPAQELGQSIEALGDCEAQLHLGGHQEADFLQSDLLIVNPAVPKDSPLLKAAMARGVSCTTEINLFIERCPARMVGITGSVGKSTTTAMIAAILSRQMTTHVGGNIGKSLLEELDRIGPTDAVVLELSSFQLEDLPIISISPHVALVTNLLPNHLDRHGTMETYTEAKKNIFRFQSGQDVLLLNATDEATACWKHEAPARVEMYGQPAAPFELKVPGRHNQVNAQAAWAAARQMGVQRATAAAALREFAGLEHRLQFVIERGGVRYFNDSKCTTPQGAIVAMEAFAPRTAVMIVGGYDKHVSFDEMAAAISRLAKAVVVIGATGQRIAEAVEAARGQGACGDAAPALERADGLADAVAKATRLAAGEGAVLLSPGCASYDMFTNYEHRGQAFVDLVSG